MPKEYFAEELYPDDALAAEFDPVEDDYDDDEASGEYDDVDDEEDYIDDENVAELAEDDYDDDEAEFLGMMLPGLIGKAVGGARGIGRAFSPRRVGGRRYRPYNPIRVSGGVRTGYVRTPRGRAPVRLNTTAVPLKTFQAAMRGTNGRINSLNRRLNQTQQDVKRVDGKATQAASLAATNSQAIIKLDKTTKSRLRRWSRYQNSKFAKLKKDQESKATTNLLMNMMQYNNLQSQLAEHTHDNSTGVAVVEEGNNMMMLLPLLMSDSDGDDDGMMMAMMFMMMNNNNS